MVEESTIIPEPQGLRDDRIIGEGRWADIHHARAVEHCSVSRSARAWDHHQRRIDRFAAAFARIVSTDYLVAFEASRYSAPFTLAGQTVDVRRREGQIESSHRGRLVASHPESAGPNQLAMLPEHGPGALARNARQRYATPAAGTAAPLPLPTAESGGLACFDALCPRGVA